MSAVLVQHEKPRGPRVRSDPYREVDDRLYRWGAWPLLMVAVELEGWAAFQGHASLEGFQKDCEKYNAATELGWRLYRFTGRAVRKGDAVFFMERVLLLATRGGDDGN